MSSTARGVMLLFQFEKKREQPGLTTKTIGWHLVFSHTIQWKEHLMPNTKQIRELTTFFFSWKCSLHIVHSFLDSANFSLLSEVKIVRMDERTNVWALITWLAQIDAKSGWIQYFLLKNNECPFMFIELMIQSSNQTKVICKNTYHSRKPEKI